MSTRANEPTGRSRRDRALAAAAVRSRRRAWYALGVLTAANFLHYGNRNVLYTMYEDLRRAFAFTNSELGLIGTAFMLSHALVTPLVGWAGDRFDRRRIIALAVAGWSAGAYATGFESLLFSRALVGAGTAACVPLVAVIDDLAVDDRAASAQALAVFIVHLVGTAPSSWLLGLFADAHGLERAMLVPTFGVLVAALMFFGGWRTIAEDRAKARAASGQMSSAAL